MLAPDEDTMNEQTPNNDRELYSEVATKYSAFRPQYPAVMIDTAIARCNLRPAANVLEIGCGPGTATLPLLQRGLHLTCVEPSSGMLAEARQLCNSFANVTFHQNTFQEFQGSCQLLHAVVAATSFQWVADKSSIQKIHGLMHNDSALILLWNLPLEPPPAVREEFARKTGRPSPFFFGGFSVSEHRENIRTRILDVVESSGLFEEFSHDEHANEAAISINEYLGFLSTLSGFIRMTEFERERFFSEARQVFNGFGEQITCTSSCFLNVAKKRK